MVEAAFDAETDKAFVNTKLILPGKIAFGETEVINSVEQVGFPDAIAAANTYDPLIKTEGGLRIVFELQK